MTGYHEKYYNKVLKCHKCDFSLVAAPEGFIKKKYCAPLIREVVFKVEEAVSTCITDGHGTVIASSITPEDDYPIDSFAQGKYVGYVLPYDSAYWFEAHRNIWGNIVYEKRTDLLVANDSNAS